MPTTSAPPDHDLWSAALASLDDAQLKLLLQARPDLLIADLQSLRDLARQVTSPASAGLCHRQADRASQQVLEALMVLGRPTPGELAAALGSTPDAVGPVLGWLRSLGMLLVGDGDRLVVNPGLERSLYLPCGLGPSLEDLLGHRTKRDLMAMASRLGLSTAGAKAELLTRLVAALGDERQLRAVLATAPPGVEELLGDGSALVTVSGSPQYLEYRGTGPEGWCLQRGILFALDWDRALIPREVGRVRRGGHLFADFQAAPPDPVTHAVDQAVVDARAAEAALALVRDVEAVAELWSGDPAQLLKAGGLGVREVRRAAKAVGRTEESAARLAELAFAAGLLGINLQGTAAPADGYDTWRQLGVPERWEALASAWLSLPRHLGDIGRRDAAGKPIPPLAGARPTAFALEQRVSLLQPLEDSAEGHAPDPVGLIATARWHRPSVWPSGTAADRWVLDEATEIGLVADGALSGPGRHLIAGRAAQATAALAGLAPPVTETVILQADLTATVPGEAAGSLRTELDLVAELESSGAATVWRFTEASLQRALDAGRSPEDILGLLERHAAYGVPQALAYLVTDLGRRHGRIRVGSAGCYVRCDDAALLAEALRSKRAVGAGLRLLAPTVAVSDHDREEVTAALRAAGYLAAGEHADGTIALRRPVAHRAMLSARHPGLGPASRREVSPLAREPCELDVDALDDLDDLDDVGAEDIDDGMFGAMAADPELFASMSGLPPEVAALALDAAAAGRVPPSSDHELDALVARLRAAPVQPAARPSPMPLPSAAPPPVPGAALGPSPFEDDCPRPATLVRGARAVLDVCDHACEHGWAVRLRYVNGKGHSREVSAEVLDVHRDRITVHYLDERGGGELVASRVEWVRVLTEAEEENL